MRQNPRLTWSVALAIGIPVLALTGCPGLLGGTTPSPSPSPSTSASTAASTAPTSSPAATATPTASPTATATPLRTGLLVKEVKLDDLTPPSSRSFMVVNKTGADIADLGEYFASYEYADSGTNKMQHLRFGKGAKLAKDASFKVWDKTCTSTDTASQCVTVDSSLGGSVGATQLGIQAGQGSLVIYKTSTANFQDYVQYGTKPSTAWVHSAGAVSAKVWDATESYAPAISAQAGKEIEVKTLGATGAANWAAD